MEKKYRITLDTDKQEILDTNIVVCQGDKGFVFDIVVEGIDTTGTTAHIIFKKADGNVDEYMLTHENGRYPYTFLGSEVSAPGTVIADVKITEDATKRVSSTKFKFFVDTDTENGSTSESTSYLSTLETAVSKAQEAKTAAETARTAAETAAENAAAVSGIEIATEFSAGIVKGSQDVAIASDGTMSVTGGNANTLDGKSSGRFMHFRTIGNEYDFNTMLETGMYLQPWGSTQENASANHYPCTDHGLLMVWSMSPYFVEQLYIVITDSSLSLYHRKYDYNAWTSWVNG